MQHSGPWLFDIAGADLASCAVAPAFLERAAVACARFVLGYTVVVAVAVAAAAYAFVVVAVGLEVGEHCLEWR